MPLSAFPSFPTIGFPKRTATMGSARQVSMSNRRTIIPQQLFPRWSWGLTWGALRSAAYGTDAAFLELETLVGFFNARSADGMCFSYTDQEDNAVTADQFGSGDGASVDFQMYRTYGGFAEPVYLPTITDLEVTGVPQTEGVDYTVSALGVVTFAVAPVTNAPLTWSGTYDWLCRFDQDALSIDMIVKGWHEPSDAVTFSAELNP